MTRPSYQDEIEYLAALRETGVIEVELEYKGRRPRVRRAAFGDTSPGDLKRLLENFEGRRPENGSEDEDHDKIEKRRRDKVNYHSS